jgi:hypothetical protein
MMRMQTDIGAVTADRRAQRPLLRRRAVAALLGAATLAMLIAAAPARAGFWDGDATPLWVNYENGPGNGDDSAADVQLTAGGVTFFAGSWTNAQGNADISLAKYLTGDPVWSTVKTYDGSAHGNDWAKKMALGPGGVVYVTGLSTNAAGNLDIVVVKWSGTSGKRLWVRRYDGPKHLDDGGSAIGVDRRGNVTVAGYSRSDDGQDVLVRSWSAAGAVRWTWRYDGAAHGDDSATDLLVARDGSVYVSALVKGEGGVMTALVARRSSAGMKKWVDLRTGMYDLGAVLGALTSRPGGGVYACGYEVTPANGNDGLILGYASDGSGVYVAHDGGPTDQAFNDVAVTTNGHVVGAGYTVIGGDLQPRYVRFDLEGTPASSTTTLTSGSDEFTAVTADAFGGYAMTGTSTNASGDMRIITRRLSTMTNGGVWLSEMLPFTTSANRPSAIAVRGGMVVVVGSIDTGGVSLADQFAFTYVY